MHPWQGRFKGRKGRWSKGRKGRSKGRKGRPRGGREGPWEGKEVQGKEELSVGREISNRPTNAEGRSTREGALSLVR